MVLPQTLILLYFHHAKLQILLEIVLDYNQLANYILILRCTPSNCFTSMQVYVAKGK